MPDSSVSSLNKLAQRLKDRLSVDSDSLIFVAYSGGLDSSLLLHAAAMAFGNGKVHALHCNHGISDRAQSWADHCREQAGLLGTAYTEKKLDLGKQSSEEKARDARYQFFSKQMSGCSSPVLLMGHHADDQIETLLFRMFRGSGLKGLSAIPQCRDMQQGTLFRPFLDLRKKTLLDLARTEGISWVEDDSNQLSDYDRNFIRNQLIPLIQQRWPKVSKQLLHVQHVLAESDVLLDEYAEILVADLKPKAEAFGKSYSINRLKKLNPAQQKMVLRYLVSGFAAVQLNDSDLAEIDLQFFKSRVDAKPVLKVANAQLRRYKNRLYILTSLPEELDQTLSISWDGTTPLEIKGLGTLSLAEPVAGELFEVRFRQGSERAKPLGRDRSQTLKKILQESEVEPWLRDCLPLVFSQNRLLTVADCIRCSEHRFSWQWESR